MSRDDKHSDKDLKAYLDGTDGVSAAYRKTARDEPPAALDRAILAAARAEVVSKEPEIGGRQMPYRYGTAALAASVMVGILAASLYFNPQQFMAPVSVPTSAESAALDERQTETESADQADAPTEFETRQLAPAVQTVSVAPANRVAAPAPPSDLTTDAFARLAESPPVVIQGPLLEQIEADAAEAQGVARQDFSYRQSREDWLEEIRTQVAELETLGRLTGNTVYQEQRLQEEMDLYMQMYPDADLDADLAESYRANATNKNAGNSRRFHL